MRLLPHHRYVCLRHRHWIGPPDIGKHCARLPEQLEDIICAQRRHLRLLARHGVAATYDGVLTGFLICGHLWAERSHAAEVLERRWARPPTS